MASFRFNSSQPDWRFPPLPNATQKNSQFQEKGSHWLPGVGHTTGAPRAVLTEQAPEHNLFLHFDGSTSSTAEANFLSIRNVVSVHLMQLKITNAGAGDILAIKFHPELRDHVKVRTITNREGLGESYFYVDRSGATISENFTSGRVLATYHDPTVLTGCRISIRDLAGDPVTFDDAYFWLIVKTVDWQ